MREFEKNEKEQKFGRNIENAQTRDTWVYVQLDWPSETDTLKINLPRDREGYVGFEYTDEKLSTRRIQWCGVKMYISFL